MENTKIDTVPWILPKTEADFILLMPRWVKRIPAKPASHFND